MWPFNRHQSMPASTPIRRRPPSPPAAVSPTAPAHQRLAIARVPEDREGVAKLAADVEGDYQFKLGRLTIESLIVSNPVTFSGGDDPRAVRLATDLKDKWDAALPHMLRAIAFGRVAFEKTYRHDAAAGVTTLDGLDALPFDRTSMELTPDGAFGGVRLDTPDKALLPAAGSWWLALNPTIEHPHGRSLYDAAVANCYNARRDHDAHEKKWASRYAIGQGVARYPEPDGGAADDAKNHPRTVLASALSQIESGGVLLLSSVQQQGADGAPTGVYEYDYTQSTGLGDATPLLARRANLDTNALRAMGIPERALTQDAAVGSFSMAQAHQLILFALADGILKQIVVSFMRYVVTKLWEINAGSVPCPINQAWKTLLQQAQEAAAQAAQQPAPPAGGFGMATGYSMASGFSEGKHPRDGHGKFVSGSAIAAAALDPLKAKALRATITKPDQLAIFDASLADAKKNAGGVDVVSSGSAKASGATTPQVVNFGKADIQLPESRDPVHVKAAADKAEAAVASMVGGSHVGSVDPTTGAVNPPYDAHIPKAKSRSGRDEYVEVKYKHDGAKNAVSVHDDALLRKVEHGEAHPDSGFHTVLIDVRDQSHGGTAAEHYQGHSLYYRRGAGAYSTANMHPVKNEAELKRLVAMGDDDLPEKARGSLPVRTAKLEAGAAKVAEGRARREDPAKKAARRNKSLALKKQRLAEAQAAFGVS